jgi:hypothetical protein
LGTRLTAEARSSKVRGINIAEACAIGDSPDAA